MSISVHLSIIYLFICLSMYRIYLYYMYLFIYLFICLRVYLWSIQTCLYYVRLSATFIQRLPPWTSTSCHGISGHDVWKQGNSQLHPGFRESKGMNENLQQEFLWFYDQRQQNPWLMGILNGLLWSLYNWAVFGLTEPPGGQFHIPFSDSTGWVFQRSPYLHPKKWPRNFAKKKWAKLRSQTLKV